MAILALFLKSFSLQKNYESTELLHATKDSDW